MAQFRDLSSLANQHAGTGNASRNNALMSFTENASKYADLTSA